MEDGFRRRFRELLARVQPRRLEFGVELLMGRARERAAREGLPDVEAFTRLYEETRTRVVKRVKLMAACQVVPPEARPEVPTRFLCDSSLADLARSLRAAGYEADISAAAGEALVREARQAGVALLTTDERLVEALWLPPGLDAARQLDMVLHDLEPC